MAEINQIYCVDCLVGMKGIDAGSIDMILCDLPYGVKSRNEWDTAIPAELLWNEYERIIKPNGAILLFGQGKFTAYMVMSNVKLYRYNIVWKKTLPVGFLNAKRMPLRIHEDIMVFYKRLPVYNPQKTIGHKPVNSYTKRNDGSNYGVTKLGMSGGGSTERYPTSVWEFPIDKQKCALHPTQKPLELCRYAIRTYSNAGDVILDNCCGAGTIPLAAMLEGRNYIGMDNGFNSNGQAWAEISEERIKKYEQI